MFSFRGLSRGKFLSSGKVVGAMLGCLAIGACVGPVPITPDVAGTAIDKTGDLFRVGKGEAHEALGIDEMIARTRQMAEDLELKPVKEEKHPDQLKLIYRDMRKLDITVTLVRRTPKATEIHVDVGVFGDGGMGELVLRQIIHDLPGGTVSQTRPSSK